MLGFHGSSAARGREIWISRLTWQAFLLMAAALTAKWSLVLLSPRPVAALGTEAALTPSVRPADALKLFGNVGAAPPQDLGLALTGVYATADGQGFATFSSRRGPLLVHIGKEIQPGLRVAAATAGHVILRGNGQEWRLDMKAPMDLLKSADASAVREK